MRQPLGTLSRVEQHRPARIHSLLAWVVAMLMVEAPAVAQLGTQCFVENRGQWDQAITLAARWPGLATVVMDGALVMSVVGEVEPSHGVTLVIDGLGLVSPPEAGDTGVGEVNFFLGRDASRWRSLIPSHRTVTWRHPAGGGVLEVRTTPHGPELRWSLEAQADTCASPIGRTVDEVVPSTIDGSLRIVRGQQWLRLLPPEAQARFADGRSRRVDCQYAVDQDGRISVVVRSEAGLSLTVTSGVEWSTYVGGSEFENVEAIVENSAGDFVVVGVTESLDFVTTPGSHDVTLAEPGQDIFVMALDPQSGMPKWSTFIGGAGGEVPTGAMVAENGDLVITGGGNNDFPVTPGAYFKPSANNFGGAFACRLSADGTTLLYGALVGASSILATRSSALNEREEVVIVGDTITQDLPVTPDAFDAAPTGIGDDDGFIVKFSATGSDLLYASYFGGAGNDDLKAVAVDSNGDLIVGGNVKSPPPLPADAFQTASLGEATDPYIARFSPDLGRIKAATYFGGGCVEDPRALAIGPDGSIILVGWTCSTNMPTTPDAFQPTLPGGLGIRGFVTRFNPTLTDLIFSTFVGSGLGLRLEAAHVDGSGLITVAGRADSSGFPVTAGAFDSTYNGGIGDMVVGRLRPDGKKWYYGSYVGGTNADVPEGEPVALGVDPAGAAVVGGFTISDDYPTTPGAWQETLSGPTDVGLTKLTMLPVGVARFGTATPGTLGLPAAGVTAMPKLGSSTFGVTCTQAPPARGGLLVLSSAPLEQALSAAGIALWIDPAELLGLLPMHTDGLGFCEQLLRIPSNPAAAGLTAYGQFLWSDPAGPSGWSASNALAITVQP